MKIISNIIFCFVLTSFAAAQTPADLRIRGEAKRKVLEESSWLSTLPVINIGPSIMSGRVTDIAVNPDDPTTFYGRLRFRRPLENHQKRAGV